MPKRTILFVNNKGQRVRIDAGITMGDLVRGGVQVGFLTEHAPLRDGWWKSTGAILTSKIK